MGRKIKYLMPVMLACSMMQFSCSDWTDPESINIHLLLWRNKIRNFMLNTWNLSTTLKQQTIR